MTNKRWAAGLLALLMGGVCPAFGQDSADFVDALAATEQAERQEGGQFGDLHRRGLGALGMVQGAWDHAPRGAGVLRVQFDETDTVRVRSRFLMTTTFVLPASDTLASVVLGSKLLNEVARTDRTLTVEVTDYGADTSLTLFGTSGRVYPFYVRAESSLSEATPDIKVEIIDQREMAGASITGVLERLGRKEPPVAAQASPVEVPPPDFLAPGKARGLRFEYTMAGSARASTVAPDVVFSDGGVTYLYYEPGRWEATEFPAVFRVVDGVDVPTSFEVSGTTIIVKEVGALTLVAGSEHVCIRPAGWDPVDGAAFAGGRKRGAS